MFRLWAKKFESNHLIGDTTINIENNSLTRTQKIFKAISEACVYFDLPEPIWLDSNIREFKRYHKTRFSKDSFIEDIDFDFLEVQIIEED